MNYSAHKQLELFGTKVELSNGITKSQLKVKFYKIYGTLMGLTVLLVLVAKII